MAAYTSISILYSLENGIHITVTCIMPSYYLLIP